MMRLVDLRAAIEARGFSPLVRGEIQIEVRDVEGRENAGRWTIEVEGGRAQARTGGSGAVAIDIRGLAALYTGFLPAHDLRSAGLCDGSDEDLAVATAIFAGATPWVADFF
jgi:predicted acetyltransferase